MPDWNKKTGVFSLSLILAGFGAAAAALLAWTAGATAPAIDAAKQKAENIALLQLLPEGVANVPSACSAEKDGVTFFGGFNADGELIGVVGKSSEKGYGGDVEILVGLDLDGSVRSVAPGRSAVLAGKNSETPGLGSTVLERKTVRTILDPFPEEEGVAPNPVLDQFAGHSWVGTEWKVEKDGGEFIYRTGATVTSRAVTRAAGRIAKTFIGGREALMAEMREKNGIR